MCPEAFFLTFRVRLRPEWKLAFCSAFFTGFLIHFYRLANHLLTWDSVYNFHSSQNTIYLGRCFLTLTCGISSYYDLQWIIGLLSLLYLGLVCVCLTEIFSLTKRVSIFLVSALTVSFPSVAGTFAYMYTADGYFLAMLAATLAVLVTQKYRKGFLAGLVLLALSYGSYQAYISYAVMLILVWSILQLIENKLSVKKLLSYWLRFLGMGIGGTILYLLCNRVLSFLEGIHASDYNGISHMSLPDGSGLILALKNCMIDFAYFFFGPLSQINLFKILNIVLFLLLALATCFLIKQKRLYQKAGSLCLLLLCFAAMPFVCSMIYFLTPDVRYYMLMYAGFSLIYMLPILFYDKLPENSIIASAKTACIDAPRHSAYCALILSWCCVLLTLLTTFNFSLIDNISYLYMTTSNHMTYELTARMVDRIEQLEDFENAKKLCIIGHFDDFDTISLTLPPAMAGVRNSYMISEQAHFAAMMETYFGLSLETCTKEEQSVIQASATFQEMGGWPAKDSIIQEDDVVIIKIDEK